MPNISSLCTPQKLSLYRSKTTGAWNTMADFGGVLDKRIKVPTIAPPELIHSASRLGHGGSRVRVGVPPRPKMRRVHRGPQRFSRWTVACQTPCRVTWLRDHSPDVPNLLMYDRADWNGKTPSAGPVPSSSNTSRSWSAVSKHQRLRPITFAPTPVVLSSAFLKITRVA